VARNYWCLL